MGNDFFKGEGQVRKLLREFDWASSSIGSPDTWPSELHTMMDLILQVQYPAVILWGENNSYWYNDAYIYLLGQRHPAALGKPFRDVWPELWPETGPIIENAMAGIPAYFECVPFTIAPDGVPREHYFTLSFSPVRDRGGKVLGMLNAGFETTNRVAEERRVAFELALSDRFRSLSSPDQIVAAANEMLGKQLGVSRVLYAEVDDANDTFFIRRDWNQPGSESVAGVERRLDDFGPDAIALLRRGEPLTVEDVLTDPRTESASKNYADIAVRAFIAVPVVRSGRLETMLSLHSDAPRKWQPSDIRLVSDVAERTWLAANAARTQAALRDSEARLQAVFDSLPVGVALVDGKGDVVLSNQEMTRYLPTRKLPSIDDPSSASRWRAFQADGRPVALDDYPGMRAFRGERTVPGIEMQYTRESGEVTWAQVAAVPIRDTHGALAGQVAVITNLDEQKRTEAALRASEQRYRALFDDTRMLAEKLEYENRRKSEFLAVLAHELRNPLAPIRTGLDIIRMRSDSPETVMRVHGMIDRQTTHMIHLIDDLLDVARITTGKIELKKAVVDLNDIVANAVETSLPTVEKSQHALRLHLHDGPLLLEADELRVGQIIGNLLTNAAKYTPHGGRISITVEQDGGEAVVTVADSGIGIPQGALNNVFDMFSQVERSLGQSQGGLGIGLALVRQLANLHDGTVTAASEGEGKGSTFTVRLPLGHAALDASGHAECAGNAAVAAPETVRILVVDDNVDAATSLAALLRLRGHDARVAHDGADAIRCAEQFQPQLAFLDIGMPVMSGYDLARRLRSVPALCGMRLVALTGWGTEADRNRTAEAGFDEHLTKPVSSEAIDAVLASQRGPKA